MCPSIQSYMRRLRFEKNNAFNTIYSYQHDLQDLYKYLERDIIDATSEEILDFLISLKHQHNLNNKSISRKISCFRSFYKDLMRLELRKDNPMDLIDSPKISRHIPNIVGEQELDIIFNHFENIDQSDPKKIFPKLRDMLIFEILYSCGLRVTELCELTLSSLYLDDGIIRIIGKGNKERLVPIGTSLDKLLKQYLPIRQEYLEKSHCDYLITSKFRKKVSRMFIWKVLNQYSKNLDITTLHPHMLRHAFATHMLAHGADLRLIQELLGHSDLSTTEIYTHVDKSSLANTLEMHHPFSSL